MKLAAADTIAHICSPPGTSASGIIRLSGPEAISIAMTVFSSECRIPEPPPRSTVSGSFTLTLCGVILSAPCLTWLMPGPKSYTTEDVVEFHLPGSPPLLTAALQALVEKRARTAEPGEFTLRAFLGGRIELGQAEAVERIIAASSEDERREALSRLSDHLARKIRLWRDRLLLLSAEFETALDFDEEELGQPVLEEAENVLAQLAAESSSLVTKASSHRPDPEGVRVVFAGVTNAGKSSLINALIGKEKLLTSPQPGTTRDRLPQQTTMGGMHFLLEDIPGYDAAGDEMKRGASERAMAILGSAPLVCLVVDAADAIDGLEHVVNNLPHGPVVAALTKCDLPMITDEEAIRRLLAVREDVTLLSLTPTSVVNRTGIEELGTHLVAAATGMQREGGSISDREGMELKSAATFCTEALSQLRHGAAPELVVEDLRSAINAFSRAVGEGYAEEVLESIFSRFCIGK